MMDGTLRKLMFHDGPLYRGTMVRVSWKLRVDPVAHVGPLFRSDPTSGSFENMESIFMLVSLQGLALMSMFPESKRGAITTIGPIAPNVDDHVAVTGPYLHKLMKDWLEKCEPLGTFKDEDFELVDFNLRTITKMAVQGALSSENTLTEAAERLGITRHSLKRKIMMFGIDWPPRFSTAQR